MTPPKFGFKSVDGQLIKDESIPINPLDSIGRQASAELGRQVIAFVGSDNDLSAQAAARNASLHLASAATPQHPDAIVAVMVQPVDVQSAA